MIKVLVVGSDYTWSIEKNFTKHLLSFNVETELFPAQNMFYEYYNASVFNKIKHRLGLSTIYKEINKTLLAKMEAYQPDILWVIKGMEILPQTLIAIKRKGVKLVNYNPDNPYLFSSYGSGNKNLTQSISFYDLYLSYDSGIVQQLITKGVQADVLPFGFELSAEQLAAAQLVTEINKLCFIGNPDKDRVAFLNEIAATNIAIDVYGHNWHRFKLHENITAFEAVYQNDFWKTVRKYRVQLNLMRAHNLQSHNMRSFEVPAVGGIMLAPYTPDHAQFFMEGKEAFFYNSTTDCVENIKNILGLPLSKIAEIRGEAIQASVTKKYSYRHRTEQLVEYFKSVRNGVA